MVGLYYWGIVAECIAHDREHSVLVKRYRLGNSISDAPFLFNHPASQDYGCQSKISVHIIRDIEAGIVEGRMCAPI